MYPSDDIPVMLGLMARRAQALRDDIAAQLTRIHALYDRAESAARHGTVQERTAALIDDVHHTVRLSQELVETAREHGQRSRLLVQRSRERRLLRAGPA